MAEGRKFFGLFGNHASKRDKPAATAVPQQLSITVRRYNRRDRHAVLKIAVESFSGVCLDENIEKAFGKIGAEWKQHKIDTIDYDLTNNPASCFVAEVEGEVVGFVCNRLYHNRSVGHVANLAVRTDMQGKGVGKALMNATLEFFRSSGMRYARIETLDQNERGKKFYPSLGFKEVGKQIFFFKKL
jgi:predicted N-acetyltransferase YhbS